MRLFFLTLSILFISTTGISQQLYSRAFGNAKNSPVIFLHGGPGSSSVFFEATTAKLLADRGFFVIVYDRRGEGRSVDGNARMDFNEAFADLSKVYEQYNIRKAALLAFSFGGLIGAQYAEKYPDRVQSLLLCSALVSQQESYNTILRAVKAIYESAKDTSALRELGSIAMMDTNSLSYRTLVFKHASQNGFFSLAEPTAQAKAIYDTYATDTLIKAYIKNEQAVPTFWKHESRRNIDVTPQIKFLRQRGVPVYALYGRQDGLYAPRQISDLRKVIGNRNVRYLDHCSHTLFIDQQQQFLSAAEKWLRR